MSEDAGVDRLTRPEIEYLVGQFALLAARADWKPKSIDRIRAFGDLALQSLSQEAVRDEAQIQAETLAQLLGAAILRLKALGETSWELPPYARALALKREPNAAGWNEKGIADIGVLPGEVDTTAGPAPAAPELEVETQFSIAKRGPKYEFEIDGKWPVVACPDPQECRRANRCLNEPPCGKFEAMTAPAAPDVAEGDRLLQSPGASDG